MSSLEPILWFVCMSEWLEKIGRENARGGVYRQAFADDQVMLVADVSIKGIEKKWKENWENRWRLRKRITGRGLKRRIAEFM